jgi:hypothetical protein
MDYGRLFKVAESVRSGQRLLAEDTNFIREEIPIDLPAFPQIKPPKSIRHPGGFSVSGAPDPAQRRQLRSSSSRKEPAWDD